MRLASIVTALCSSVKLGRSTAIAPIVWYPRRCHPFTNSFGVLGSPGTVSMGNFIFQHFQEKNILTTVSSNSNAKGQRGKKKKCVYLKHSTTKWQSSETKGTSSCCHPTGHHTEGVSDTSAIPLQYLTFCKIRHSLHVKERASDQH